MVSGSSAAKPLSNTAFDQGMQRIHVDMPQPDTVIQPLGAPGPAPVVQQPSLPQQGTVIQPSGQQPPVQPPPTLPRR